MPALKTALPHVFVALGALTAHGVARADACAGLIGGTASRLDDLRRQGVEFPQVAVTMSINQANGTVSYTDGALFAAGRNALSGDFTQYFNDRRYPAPSGHALGEPFNARQTDRLGLALSAGNPSQLVLTLQSWGNTRMTYAVRCEGPFVIGDGYGHKVVLTIRQ